MLALSPSRAFKVVRIALKAYLVLDVNLKEEEPASHLPVPDRVKSRRGWRISVPGLLYRSVYGDSSMVILRRISRPVLCFLGAGRRNAPLSGNQSVNGASYIKLDQWPRVLKSGRFGLLTANSALRRRQETARDRKQINYENAFSSSIRRRPYSGHTHFARPEL